VPAGASAQARTVETASLGPVTADLSYVQHHRGSGSRSFIEYRDFRVRIQRNGQVLYDKPIGEPCERFCTPTDSELTRAHIGMAELDGDSEFEVIVDLFTGGANCCVLIHAFGYDPVANTYRRARLDTGGGFTHSDYPPRDDVVELVGDDFRFRGLFTCGACGWRPLRIWHYTLSGFEVVTRSFPDQIREHAARMKRQYERVRHRRDAPVFVKGALTPYAADLCPARPLRRGLPARAARDQARRAQPALGLRRGAPRARVPQGAEALPAPQRLPPLGRVAAEALLDASHLVVQRLVGAVAALVQLEHRVDARHALVERHRVQLAHHREDVLGRPLEGGAHRVHAEAHALLPL
jgi:hypothetical protein